MKKTLSKSRYVSGLQCHRLLWWKVNEPKAEELVPDPALQRIFDQGTKVGELARTYVPGGVLIDEPHYRKSQRVTSTRQALESGAEVIYEASFQADDVYAAVDIFARGRRGWRIIEVKSTTQAKEEHLPDAAIQSYIVKKTGLDVQSVEIMYLNRECRFPDLSNLFARQDVSAEIAPFIREAPANIQRQLEIIAGPLPYVAPGLHCDVPYECPFKSRCWNPAPEHHVGTLYRLGKQTALDMEDSGIITIYDLPVEQNLSAVAERQRQSVLQNRLIVEPGLKDELAQIKHPVGFLDFETIMSAIPCWDGCRPYDQVVVQFSYHKENEAGGYDHHEYIADGSDDPRKELVENLIQACRGEGSIIVYNVAFERTRLIELAEVVPDYSQEIESIIDRLVDLLPIVRNNVYHPNFHGSFSLKSVVPALVPDLSYNGLAVQDGGTAMGELERLLFNSQLGQEDKKTLKENLLKYCKLDTWATVRLLEQITTLSTMQ